MSEEAPKTEVHTYPDGSQRVGVAPFPETSPIEDAAAIAAAAPIEESNTVTANDLESTMSKGDGPAATTTQAVAKAPRKNAKAK